jgi:hypothetical protein
MVFPFLKVLLGTGRFEVLGAWSKKTEGASVAGHHRFVTSPLLSFSFFRHIFAITPAFSWFQTIISVWLLY